MLQVMVNIMNPKRSLGCPRPRRRQTVLSNGTEFNKWTLYNSSGGIRGNISKGWGSTLGLATLGNLYLPPQT